MAQIPEVEAPQDQWADVRPILDEELSRLPDHYRAVIVLCDLEGRSRKEVASQFSCPEGTVASRLARARDMLAKRLTQRGVALSGGALVLSISAAVPTPVVASTIKAASLCAAGQTAIPAKVAALTEGVLKAMMMNKLKTVVAVVLMLGVIVTAATVLSAAKDYQPPAAPVKEPNKKEDKVKDKEGFTAWGKEVGGLQAGLGYLPGEHRAYATGETVTLVVRVRNVSKEAVKFQYVPKFFFETPPTVTDGEGKPVASGERLAVLGEHGHVDVDLAPGKEAVLKELKLKLKPVGDDGKMSYKAGFEHSLQGIGKFNLQYEQVLHDSSSGKATNDPALDKLGTGKLELEVKEADDKKPPHIVEKPDMKGRYESFLPCQSTEAGGVVVKSFFAQMPNYPNSRFREFFDPRYLKEHGLTDRDIAFEIADHQGIDSLVVADDKYTVLAVLDLKGGGKEAFVMRCVVYEGHIYISPENAPDPKTGIFKPWILRTKL